MNIIDVISNSYYLKTSLNSISDIFSVIETPREIIKYVSCINDYIFQIKEECVSLQDINFELRDNNYTTIKKQLSDIHELIEKFENIEWNHLYIKMSEDTENNSI